MAAISQKFIAWGKRQALYDRAYPELSTLHRAVLASSLLGLTLDPDSGMWKSVRTHALNPLIRHTPIPKDLATWMQQRDRKADHKKVGPDEIYRPEDDLPSFKQMVSTHGFVDPAVVYFGNISYHSDDVYADQQAYALWCLDAAKGSQLVVGGNHYDVQSGDLVFFDAAIVHAWKQPSKRPTLAILASVPWSPELRKAMGVQKVPYQKLTPQDEERMDYPWNARNVTEPKDGSLPSSWERLAPG